MKIKELSLKMGVSNGIIYSYIKLLKMSFEKSKVINLTEDEVEKLENFHEIKANSFSLYEIAKGTSYSYPSISNFAKELDIKPLIINSHMHLYTKEQKELILTKLDPDKEKNEDEKNKKFELIESSKGYIESSEVLTTYKEDIKNAMLLSRRVNSLEVKAYKLKGNMKSTYYLKADIEKAIKENVFSKKTAGPKKKIIEKPKNKVAAEFITAGAVSKILGVKRQRIHQMIDEKLLLPDFVGKNRVNYFKEKSILIYKKIHMQPVS